MTDSQSTSFIPEKQFATGKLGQPLSIILKGEDNVPPPGPGMVVMEHYETAFLRVESCGWYPAGELAEYAAAFRVIFTPLQAGKTEINFLIQPRAINPLNLPVTFFVTIDS